MGHVRLGTLPRTRPWQQVVALVGANAPVNEVAAATASAAKAALAAAPNDAAFVRAFWLLTQLPLAARSASYLAALRGLGLAVETAPTLIGLGSGIADAVDLHVAAAGGASDIGEMAQAAAVESLTAMVGRDLPELFGTTPDDVQLGLGRFAGRDRFAALTRDFFSRLLRRHFDYYLSRELPAHVGADRRFASVAAHAEFDRALELHCRETTRIVEAFAGGWYSKANFEGGITPAKASRFIRIALNKIDAELRKREQTRA